VRGRAESEAAAHACADLAAAVLASALGLRARAQVRPLPAVEGGGFAYDVAASRERPRGSHAPHAVRFIVIDDAAALIQSNPFVRLAVGGTLAVPSAARSADALWAELPAYVKAIAFDRRARVLGWQPPPRRDDGVEATWMMASAVAGLAVAMAQDSPRSLDASLVAREVEDALHTAFANAAHAGLPSPPEARRAEMAKEGASTARAVFEAHVEVPRATVERDEEAVRFGRKDARAQAPPRS
jgi:hypothetical protein